MKILSKPRGWYRTFVASVKSDNQLARKYDVVHCMSGGFLNLYLTLASGAQLEFDTLVLDSTPIMPKPSSFVRFLRAWLEDSGSKGRAFNRYLAICYLIYKPCCLRDATAALC